MTEETVLIEKHGDLFSSSKMVALAHCVSADFKMGAGIAVEFRDRFGHVKELIESKTRVGQVATLQFEKERAPVYYLVTKEKYYNKPTYETLASCLQNLAQCCVRDQVVHLAIPRIATGLDKLEWNQVKKILSDTFNKQQCKTITIFVLV